MTTGTRVGTFYTRDWGEVALWKTTYAETNHLALIVTDTRAKNLMYGSPIAIVSVNMDESAYLPPDCCYLKDWTENARLAEDLRNSGWLEPRDFDLPVADNGYIQAKPYQLRTKRKELIGRGAEPRDACPAPAPRPSVTPDGPAFVQDAPWNRPDPTREDEASPFRSGGGGDFGGGGAEASWDAPPAPAPSYAEAPSPAPAPAPASSESCSASSYDSSSSSGGGGGSD